MVFIERNRKQTSEIVFEIKIALFNMPTKQDTITVRTPFPIKLDGFFLNVMMLAFPSRGKRGKSIIFQKNLSVYDVHYALRGNTAEYTWYLVQIPLHIAMVN